jgi:PA14 domain/Bacterial lectin
MRRGNIIGKPNNPSAASTSGMWNLNEQYSAQVAASKLDYIYYTHNQTTHPNTESEMTSYFTTYGTQQGTGTYNGIISWSDNHDVTSGAGGNTGVKPSYMNTNGIAWVTEGYILAPETGIYTFGVDSDDASDLFVNNVRVANFYGPHGFSANAWSGNPTYPQQTTGSISLQANTFYSFKARMEEYNGGDGIQVGWKKPSDSSITLIPGSAFYPKSKVYYPTQESFTYSNFSSTSGLVLVSISSITSNFIYLTATNNNEVGNVWREEAIKYNRNFSVTWQFECSGGAGIAADGFCLQWGQSNRMPGGLGGSVGLLQFDSTLHALAFRTYTSGSPGLQWRKNNIQQGSIQANAISWRQNVYYWADYDHNAATMKIYYSTTTSKPASANHTFSSFTFDGNPYYMGFGAATGGTNDNHMLKAWSLTI